MPPASKPLDIDARWLYRRSFLLFFLVFELLAWHRLQRFPMRAPANRVLIFLLARWATPRSFLLAMATIRKPLAANLRAIASPIPALAPVTRTTGL